MKEFCAKFVSILMDSRSLIKILEKEKFDPDNFLFTVDFESLYTDIPGKHTIESMKELVFEYKGVISNAELIIDFLEMVLENGLMEFHGEYFQQFLAYSWAQTLHLFVPIHFQKIHRDGFDITKG